MRWRFALIGLVAVTGSATGCTSTTTVYIGTTTTATVPALEYFTVPSPAMEPTIETGASVGVDPTAYASTGGVPGRGDIIVFRRPPLEADKSIAYLIKRVVGLPGESIDSGPGGVVEINGQPLSEPYLSAQSQQDPGAPITPQTIPSGEVFVLGDNRGNSSDSRVFGPISVSLIVGKVVVIDNPKH